MYEVAAKLYTRIPIGRIIRQRRYVMKCNNRYGPPQRVTHALGACMFSSPPPPPRPSRFPLKPDHATEYIKESSTLCCYTASICINAYTMICKCIAISANWLTLNMKGKQNEENAILKKQFYMYAPGPSPPVPYRTHTMLLGKGINYMYIMLLQDLSIKCLYINILLN